MAMPSRLPIELLLLHASRLSLIKYTLKSYILMIKYEDIIEDFISKYTKKIED
jgi:hypothetical protein